MNAKDRYSKSLDDCIKSGQHLKDIDNDGYCNYCGSRETQGSNTNTQKTATVWIVEERDYGSRVGWILVSVHNAEIDALRALAKYHQGEHGVENSYLCSEIHFDEIIER
jgi:hypothetical protein